MKPANPQPEISANSSASIDFWPHLPAERGYRIYPWMVSPNGLALPVNTIQVAVYCSVFEMLPKKLVATDAAFAQYLQLARPEQVGVTVRALVSKGLLEQTKHQISPKQPVIRELTIARDPVEKALRNYCSVYGVSPSSLIGMVVDHV